MRAARTRRGFGRVVVFVVLRYIYIYIFCILKERKKERERRSDVEVMCVWVRETSSISYVGEKNERNVPPRDKTHEKGGDNRIFFQEFGDAAI